MREQNTNLRSERQHQSAKPEPSKGSETANDFPVCSAISGSVKSLTSRDLIPNYELSIPNCRRPSRRLARFFHKPSYFRIRQATNKQKPNSAFRITHSALLAAFGG